MTTTRPSVSLPTSLATAARDAGISLSYALQYGVARLLVAQDHAVPVEPAPPPRTAAATRAAAARRREAPGK